jgi:hypothetical protein
LLQTIQRSNELLYLIHSNIGDLKFVQTRGGKRYYIIFIDDCTRYCYIYIFMSKDEVLEMIKHYKNKVNKKINKKIKVIRSDKGGEYDTHLVNSIPKIIVLKPDLVVDPVQ